MARAARIVKLERHGLLSLFQPKLLSAEKRRRRWTDNADAGPRKKNTFSLFFSFEFFSSVDFRSSHLFPPRVASQRSFSTLSFPRPRVRYVLLPDFEGRRSRRSHDAGRGLERCRRLKISHLQLPSTLCAPSGRPQARRPQANPDAGLPRGPRPRARGARAGARRRGAPERRRDRRACFFFSLEPPSSPRREHR